jgi:hypothetical protein
VDGFDHRRGNRAGVDSCDEDDDDDDDDGDDDGDGFSWCAPACKVHARAAINAYPRMQ